MTSTTKSRSNGSRAGRKSPSARVDIYQEVTDRVLEALAAGTVPWRKPWNTDTGLPVSLSTHKPYRGVNVFLLGLAAQVKGYRSPWWGTYDAILKHGGRVRTATCDGPRCSECRGTMLDLRTDLPGPLCVTCGGSTNTERPGVKEKCTYVTFWRTFEKKEIDPVTGKPTSGMVLRRYSVFNSEQADWADGKAPVIPDLTGRTPAERIAAADAIVIGYENVGATNPAGPRVCTTGRAAYYRPGDDVVTVPPLSAFTDPELYYSTLFHELTHSTGHESRLNRPGVAQFDHFGSDRYGREELTAEMGAALLSGIAGLSGEESLPATANYIASWLDTLRADSKLVVKAAAAAQKAADHVLGVTRDDDTKKEA